MHKPTSLLTAFRRYCYLSAFSTLVAVFIMPATASAQNGAHLRYVPADTFLFLGNLEPFSLSDAISLFPSLQDGRMREMMENAFESDEGEEGVSESPGIKAFVDIYAGFVENPEENMAAYGIDSDKVISSIYVVGVSPVIRVGLNDVDQFQRAMDAFDKDYELEPLIQPLSGSEVRIYELDDTANSPRMAVSVVGNDAVFGFSFNDEDLLRTLGFDAIQDNLANSDIVPDLRSEYGYGTESVGFLDLQKLAQTFTDSDSESGKSLMAAMGNADEIAALRTPQCQSEMQQIASIWPRLVFGYQNYDVTSDGAIADAHIAVEINHPGITGALSKLRGHIPETVTSADSLLSVAFGLDISRLGQAVSELGMLMSGFNYQCEALASFNAIQPEMLQQGIMGINMFSGMAQGMRGFSMSLFDIDFDGAAADGTGSPSLNKLDAMINIPAKNPQLLLNMAKMVPQLASFTVPEDGSAVEIGQAIAAQMGQELPVDVNLAQRGNQIVLFAGDESTALASDDSADVEQDNGFMFFSMDMKRFFELAKEMENVIPETGSGSQIDQQLEVYSEMYSGGGFTTYALDFTDRGIEINARVNLLKSQ